MEISYKYKGIDDAGIITEGVFQANSKQEVLSMLREKGHRPIRIEEIQTGSKDLKDIGFLKPRVKLKDMSVFCKQMYTMLNAGMPLTNCIEVLSEQTENKTLAVTLREVQMDIQTGEILSQAMKKHKKVFPTLLITMIEAGEMTGNLDTVLFRMSEHYEKENKINSKVKGAMVYPTVLSIASVLVVVFLLTFIMPTFTGMFMTSGVELPAATLLLMKMSDALQSYWYVFLLGIAVTAFGFITYNKTENGKRQFDHMKQRIPVINNSIKKIATSRFTRTLSTLLASGIPIVQAMESSARVTDNMIVIDGVDKVIEDMKKGINISYLLRQMHFFPPMVISMVGIGEESGSLEEMLTKTADYYDEELEASIQKMLSMLEPLLILFMGVIIGFIVIAMMMPIFDMTKTV